MTIRIPAVAWSRSLGLGYEPEPRPRVTTPMIDDGPWAGVPIGGLGAGSIGRTQRGDFARWHLRIGEHRFESSPADGFAVWVGSGTGAVAQVLRTTPPPAGWGRPLEIGAGTYRALFPRSWFEFDSPGLPIRITEEQLSPVIPGDDAAASLPVGTFELELENPGPSPVDAAVLLAWADPLGDALDVDGRRPDRRVEAFDSAAAIGLAFVSEPGSELAGSFAIAAPSRGRRPDHQLGTGWRVRRRPSLGGLRRGRPSRGRRARQLERGRCRHRDCRARPAWIPARGGRCGSQWPGTCR